MAGDWIKMRVWISKDPRVIAMADYLAGQREFMNWLTDPVRHHCKETAYSHVTRNVTVALCVTALLVTWGTAREQGDRDGDDLVMNHADLVTLDAMTDLPCFGDAMAFVGWAIEEEGGAVRFPKFFKDNESPDDRHKRQAAERQARHREKKSLESNGENNVTSNVTVTHREEKRREEKTPIASRENRVPQVAWSEAGFQIPESVKTGFKEAYPAADIDGEIAKAHAWALANPKNRKSNWGRFLNSWLQKAQDRAPRIVDNSDWRKDPRFQGML